MSLPVSQPARSHDALDPARILALSIPASASAERFRIKRNATADKTAVEDAGAAPAVVPAEGSLWDYIEEIEGSVPAAPAAIGDSEELDAERSLEETFLAEERLRPGPPTAVYVDPVDATAADPYHLAELDPSDFDIPIVVNDDVIRWMDYFTGKGRKYYAKWMRRSGRYRPMMYRKLDEAGLPRDLVYLSMIESGYATHAYSRAAAVGLWQFITPTAREAACRLVDGRPQGPGDGHGCSHPSSATSTRNMVTGTSPGRPTTGVGAREPGNQEARDTGLLGTGRKRWVCRGDGLRPETHCRGHHRPQPRSLRFTDIDYMDELVYDESWSGPT